MKIIQVWFTAADEMLDQIYLGVFRTRLDESSRLFLSQVDDTSCGLFQQLRLKCQESYDAHTCIQFLCYLRLPTGYAVLLTTLITGKLTRSQLSSFSFSLTLVDTVA